ncbi:LysR family transcriptional regulator [Novosphingobium indicum]|uniref:LysR family transcriptional regulator n=1 Tax=Novosphingobium indicum TaxID=462949 RepID=A0ABQ2K161_9SPHN|nr:LysR family transcriptional regulator [Novosphingobium indicum]GGN61686.1 LysR family transcriptional regulator [Novosphingobium indicum]
MDLLSCIKTFVEVAHTKSFTAAAQRRGLSRASATKHVAALEDRLGARLFTRNSQFVVLTEAGETMLSGSVRLLEELEGLTEQVKGQTKEVTGLIRIGVPPSFGAHYLVPALINFLEDAANVEISIFLDDGSSNLVREGLDISIRIGESLPDTDEVAKLLTDAPQLAVASPEYLARAPRLETPEDLANHQCLVHALKSPTEKWSFVGPDGPVTVKVKGRISANFGTPLLAASVAGQGITIHPTYMVKEFVQAGKLVVVLPDYQPTALRIHAIYPQRRFLPVRIRIFLDFLKKWLVDNRDRLEI